MSLKTRTYTSMESVVKNINTDIKRKSFMPLLKENPQHYLQYSPCLAPIQHRGAVFCSRRGKRKTVKSVTKRFKRLRSGKLLRWKAGKNHNMRKKSSNQRRRLRRPVVVKGKQLRKLNKMISGW